MNGFWLNKTIEDWQARIPGIINSFEIQISEINKSKNNASSGRVGNGLVAQNAVALFNSKLNDVTAKRLTGIQLSAIGCFRFKEQVIKQTTLLHKWLRIAKLLSSIPTVG